MHRGMPIKFNRLLPNHHLGEGQCDLRETSSQVLSLPFASQETHKATSCTAPPSLSSEVASLLAHDGIIAVSRDPNPACQTLLTTRAFPCLALVFIVGPIT